jgi:hypothetical protein
MQPRIAAGLQFCLKDIRYFLHLGLVGHSDDFDPKSLQFTPLAFQRDFRLP